MIRRDIPDSVQTATTDTPVVRLNGARQTGKTTLAQALAASACGLLNIADVGRDASLTQEIPSPLGKTSPVRAIRVREKHH